MTNRPLWKRLLTYLTAIVFIAFSLSIQACKDDDPVNPVIPTPSCDTTYVPVIFVHGFLASGDTYASQAQRFSSNRYCGDYLYVFDWNTLGNQGDALLRLDSLVNRVMQQHSKSQVHLAGHSAGGGLCYSYLSDAARAAKVARYAHIGSSPQSRPAGPNGSVPTLNLWSSGDKIVQGADIPGATNVSFAELDHYEIATSPQSFEALFSFFNEGKQPTTLSVVAESSLQLAGRVVTLGENRPLAQATVEIYALDPATGSRLRTTPDASLLTDGQGNWGPWTGKPQTHYEFFVRSADPADRPIHYYREPFSRSDKLVYLRLFPPPSSIAGILLSGIPRNDNQTVLAVFSANKAVIHQRDQLSVNDFNLATATYAAPARTSIAFFLYDDGNGQSSGNIHAAFNFLTSFMVGIDYFMPTATPGSIRLQFNGRSLQVPNWKSNSDGVVVAVFD